MKHKFPLELLVWLGGLILLALSNPQLHHFSLCPLAGMGISWCPGCGLGRSISSLLHLDFINSFRYHWFGIPAFLILVHRIFKLSQKNLLNLEP
jgi:hypothetical protein